MGYSVSWRDKGGGRERVVYNYLGGRGKLWVDEKDEENDMEMETKFQVRSVCEVSNNFESFAETTANMATLDKIIV